jgi:hypothetical protein
MSFAGFPPPALARYRRAVQDKSQGAARAKIVVSLRQAGYEVGGESYKKRSRGVPEDPPRAALLKHGGLHAGWETTHPKELSRPAFVELVAKRFAAVAPLHSWLQAMGR